MRVPSAVRWIARTLEEAGHETWAVGGAVRDALLGQSTDDWDLATRALPGQVRRLFRRTVPIGIEHGTVGVLAKDGVLYEITTFRRDVATDGRHAVVEFADHVEDDLSRRDFTINAIAWHPLREELLDPFGGVVDLARRVLRTVGDPEQRFAEDYLRVLRACRFAGQFELAIEPACWRSLCAAVTRLERLSAERIREELVKVLGARRPSASLGLYGASGVLRRLFPEMDATIGASRPDGRPGDVWSHGLLMADVLSPHRPRVRLAAVLWGVGVPQEASPPGPPATGNAVTSLRQPGRQGAPRGLALRAALRAAAILERTRFSGAEIQRVGGTVRWAMERPPRDASGAELRRWLSRGGLEHVKDVVRIWTASARVDEARDPGSAPDIVTLWRGMRRELGERPPLRVADLALNGRDLIALGLEPGPRFGEILDYLLDRVVDDPALNRPERLEELVRAFTAVDGGPGSPPASSPHTVASPGEAKPDGSSESKE